ncbi:MAG: cytochrome c-type biogenesis protein CcmH [Legionellaceae bacterium]|nr:cytochrome c-type biogenesis protein CcmH [Legionellaceae bacterium]
MKKLFTLLLCFFVSTCFCENIYQFTDKRQEAQFQNLLVNLRCPVCQNQDLSDSNAPLAKDLRQEVYKMVTTGKSDDEIIQHLTSRFGDFILFKPRLQSATLFLWLGPVIFVLIGFVVFYSSVRRKSDARI